MRNLIALTVVAMFAMTTVAMATSKPAPGVQPAAPAAAADKPADCTKLTDAKAKADCEAKAKAAKKP